jgi:hypothetical protein
MQRTLTFDNAPPLWLPFRFFLTAPLFALLAGLLIVLEGPQVFASRWTPSLLATTHLLTLGFAAMTMIGSLIQILPVVAGIGIPRARATAGGVHLLLTTGTLALVGGFRYSEPWLFRAALLLLLSAFSWLLIAAFIGLRRSGGRGTMLRAMRLALASLFATIVLGAVLASAFAWTISSPLSLPISLTDLTDLHASWGLLGWICLLVIGVSFQVVPMFQVTALYPETITRRLPAVIFILLIVSSLGMLQLPWLKSMASSLIAIGLAVFAVATLLLLWSSKRPQGDTTSLFWRTSMGSLLGCAALWLIHAVVPSVLSEAAYPVLLGVLFILGYAWSVINGMLYKIVPFLVWYHLQNELKGGCSKAPNVKKILPDNLTQRQFWLHLFTVSAAVGAVLWPAGLTYVAGIGFAVSSGWLWWNLVTATRVYTGMLQTDRRALASQTLNQPS